MLGIKARHCRLQFIITVAAAAADVALKSKFKVAKVQFTFVPSLADIFIFFKQIVMSFAPAKVCLLFSSCARPLQFVVCLFFCMFDVCCFCRAFFWDFSSLDSCFRLVGPSNEVQLIAERAGALDSQSESESESEVESLPQSASLLLSRRRRCRCGRCM